MVRNWLVASAIALTTAGCEGGFNFNEQMPGNGDRGVSLSAGDIAIDPAGRYYLARAGDRTVHVGIEDGDARVLSRLGTPMQMAFSPSGDQIFMVSDTGEGTALIGYDVASDTRLFSEPVTWEWRWEWEDERRDAGFSAVQVTPDGGHVIVNSEDRLWVIATDDGRTIATRQFAQTIADVDVLADSRHLLVTLMESWDDEAVTTRVVKLAIGAEAGLEASFTMDIPNCASELVVDQAERFAYLAPTECLTPETRRGKDPVSLLDLQSGEFVRNLPGFGPVGMAADGEVIVAFMDMQQLDRSLFLEGDTIPEPGSRYRLMFIDAATLSFDTIELGGELPRYAITPDGEVVLVDSDALFAYDEARIRVVDVASRAMRPVAGPLVQLDHYAFTADARTAYVVDRGLFRMDVAEARIDSVPIDFTPKNLNLTPDDRHLILRHSDDALMTFDVESGQLRHRVAFEELGRDVEIHVDVELDVRLELR